MHSLRLHVPHVSVQIEARALVQLQEMLDDRGQARRIENTRHRRPQI